MPDPAALAALLAHSERGSAFPQMPTQACPSHGGDRSTKNLHNAYTCSLKAYYKESHKTIVLRCHLEMESHKAL